MLFFGGGILAGLVQALVVSSFTSTTMHIVGSSGGIAAILGCTAMFYSKARVALLFLIPMSIKTGVLLFILGSIGAVAVFGVGAGNVAHIAHITGLVYGIGFGWIYQTYLNTITIQTLQ